MEDKIGRWLDEKGYSFEMQVARSFRQAGLRAVQSAFYHDADSKQSRETDVVVYQGRQIGKKRFAIAIVLECKVSLDKPWVLLSHENNIPAQVVIQHHACTFYSKGLLFNLAADPRVQQLEIFRPTARTGYSLVVAMGEQNDKAYAALMSVISATKGIVEGLKNNQTSELSHAIGVPAVVIKGRLFESFLDADGEVSVCEIQRGTLSWRNPILGFMTFVTIVTETGLDEFVSVMARESQVVTDLAAILVEKEL
jgi:hypothetical protein